MVAAWKGDTFKQVTMLLDGAATVRSKSRLRRVSSERVRWLRAESDVKVALSKEQHFCKPKVGSSILSTGTSNYNGLV
jgi:hypothetical protein